MKAKQLLDLLEASKPNLDKLFNLYKQNYDDSLADLALADPPQEYVKEIERSNKNIEKLIHKVGTIIQDKKNKLSATDIEKWDDLLFDMEELSLDWAALAKKSTSKKSPKTKSKSKVDPNKAIKDIVDRLFDEVSSTIEDEGEWNPHTGIDLFFDAIDDGLDLEGKGVDYWNAGKGHEGATQIKLSGKPNSPMLRKSIEAKVKWMVSIIQKGMKDES